MIVRPTAKKQHCRQKHRISYNSTLNNITVSNKLDAFFQLFFADHFIVAVSDSYIMKVEYLLRKASIRNCRTQLSL